MSLNGEADYLLESLPILFASTAFATFGAFGRGRACTSAERKRRAPLW